MKIATRATWNGQGTVTTAQAGIHENLDSRLRGMTQVSCLTGRPSKGARRRRVAPRPVPSKGPDADIAPGGVQAQQFARHYSIRL